MERISIQSDIVNPLLTWYDKGRRILPWRENPLPFYVWISEIMLQQTRVEAVKPYFDRFIEEIPDIDALAMVDDEKLMKLWEGLGYYNRARNLKKAAIIIQEKYQGHMPDTYEQIIELPGIGPYTAGAILSIAYGKKIPAVDGNVLRIIMRLLGCDRDILNARVKKEVEEALAPLIPERAGDFNQAMMELGAMVCLPGGMPKCEGCPWEHMCIAHEKKMETALPVKKKAKARTIEKKTIFVIQDENAVAIHKRPDQGLLAGLYEFPNTEGHLGMKQAVEYLEKKHIQVIHIKPLSDSRHIFSHKEWDMIGYAVRVDELSDKVWKEEEGYQLVEPEVVSHAYAIPTAFRAYANYLSIRQGVEKQKD